MDFTRIKGGIYRREFRILGCVGLILALHLLNVVERS